MSNNKNGLGKMHEAIILLTMDASARDALRQMDLADSEQVRSLARVLNAGKMPSDGMVRLISKLEQAGVKPSRAALEKLGEAVRGSPEAQAVLAATSSTSTH